MNPREFTEKAQALHDETAAELERLRKRRENDPSGGHHEEREREAKGNYFTKSVEIMADCLALNGFGEGLEIMFTLIDNHPHSTEQLPTAISESVLSVGGIDLRVAVLDDGNRVIVKDDMDKLFEAWAKGEATPTDEERLTLADFCQGRK